MTTISFGKYRGKSPFDLINDKSYLKWILSNSFLKEKYKKDYDLIQFHLSMEPEPQHKKDARYMKFYDLMYKYLDYDCLLMISDYLNLDNMTPLNRSFTGYENDKDDIMKQWVRYKNGFRHRRNILLGLKCNYGHASKLNDVNFNEHKMFHQYEQEAQLLKIVCFDDPDYINEYGHKGLMSHGEAIYERQGKLMDNYIKKLCLYCDDRIVPFGKYRNMDVTWKQWNQAQHYTHSYNSGDKWIMSFNEVRWKLDKYFQWVRENQVLDKYPLFKFYLRELDDHRHIHHMSRHLYD